MLSFLPSLFSSSSAFSPRAIIVRRLVIFVCVRLCMRRIIVLHSSLLPSLFCSIYFLSSLEQRQRKQLHQQESSLILTCNPEKHHERLKSPHHHQNEDSPLASNPSTQKKYYKRSTFGSPPVVRKLKERRKSRVESE